VNVISENWLLENIHPCDSKSYPTCPRQLLTFVSLGKGKTVNGVYGYGNSRAIWDHTVLPAAARQR